MKNIITKSVTIAIMTTAIALGTPIALWQYHQNSHQKYCEMMRKSEVEFCNSKLEYALSNFKCQEEIQQRFRLCLEGDKTVYGKNAFLLEEDRERAQQQGISLHELLSRRLDANKTLVEFRLKNQTPVSDETKEEISRLENELAKFH